MWSVERAQAWLLRKAAELALGGHPADAHGLARAAFLVNGPVDNEERFRALLVMAIGPNNPQNDAAVSEVYGEAAPVPPKTGEKMGLWRKSGIAGGKYLVQRRDGTVPEWPNFVLGAKDPAERLGFDARFTADVKVLADEFMNFRERYGEGDPDGAPHRKDDPATVARMLRGSNS
jgi:hypothetical protein